MHSPVSRGNAVSVCICSLLCAWILTACNGNNNSFVEDGNPVAENPETLEESLVALGVDTEDSPRLDSQGNPYPETYAPLGQTIMIRQIDPVNDGSNAALAVAKSPVVAKSSAALADEPQYLVGRASELFFGGFRLNTRQALFGVIDDISIAGLTESEARYTVPDLLEGRPMVEVPWAAENAPFSDSTLPGTRRDAIALDTDGDDFLEAVLVYAVQRPDGTDEIRLQIMDGKDATPIFDAPILTGGSYLPVYDLRVAGADFDGDGRDEIAFAISREVLDGVFDTPVGIYIVDDILTGYAVIDEYDVAYSASFAGPRVTLDIDSFHADHDNRDELVLVLNESEVFGQRPGNFASRHFVFGFEATGLSELSSGPIVGTVPDTESFPRIATAVVASVTTEDIDGDSLDELLFAGLEEVVESCRFFQRPDSSEFVRGAPYLLSAYGGRYNDFAPLHAATTEVFPPNCKFESGSIPFVMRHAHVNVLDFDGDGDADIQVNDMVLDSFPTGDWSRSMLATLSDKSLVYGGDKRGNYDRGSTAFAISDQTGDGIEDIVAVGLFANDGSGVINVYSWDAQATDGFTAATRIEIEQEDMLLANPIILSMDVDNDKIATVRYTGESFLDITEPMVLAAIAAAPCKRDIGQDSCYSSWGSSQSGALGEEFSVKVFGSAGAGAGSAGAGLMGKWLVKVSASAAVKTSASYELSKSQTFSTGPFEDGVIFTSIPVDRFIYQIIRDSSDGPGTIGERLEIRLPRTPNIRIVERDYYNRSITADEVPIDENIFQHTPGDVSSYPTIADKDLILRTSRSQIRDLREQQFSRDLGAFSLVPAELGLEVGPVLVGQGGGATELALEYTETFGSANELAMGVSFEAEMLAGAAISWEVGIEAGRTLSVSHGDSTLFAGSVDSIDEAFYAQNYYGFGLFAHLAVLGEQEIEVINFWVE